MRYTIYEAAVGGDRPRLGQRWSKGAEGDTHTVNANFGPLPYRGDIAQLERIRRIVNDGTPRGLQQGDLIRLGEQWWFYSSYPPEGGFFLVTRPDWLEWIREGITLAPAT